MNTKLSRLNLLFAVAWLASASQAKAQAYTPTDLTAINNAGLYPAPRRRTSFPSASS